jgi:hypothetical protein
MADLEPPISASALYKALHTAAFGFINSQTQNDNLPLRMDFDLIRTFCSPSFQHSWGHNYAVSVSPPLQGSHSFDGFAAHLQSMLPKLQSWKADVTDIVIDEVKMKVMLRISFWMVAQGNGEGEAVENDLLWVLEMEEDRERVRIKGSREFVDGVAAGKSREVMVGRG